MTHLYYDPIFLQHDTGHHPECADRLKHIVAHLSDCGLDQQCIQTEWEAGSAGRLARVHDLDYVEALQQFADRGGGLADMDTVVSTRSYEAAYRAAGAVCDAVQRVVQSEDTTALCLVRPPGHHALRSRSMGFCLLNNIAVAARVAIDELQLDRVLIVDWDVHHGNGTQDAFWDDQQVGFLSIHRWPFYPGTGAASETGRGAALGTVVNLPVQYGTPRREYVAQFASELEDFADRMRPQLVLISAGFDSHARDPIGSLGLEVEDFAELTQLVVQMADQHAGGRIVSVLEGGYNPPVLAECVETHLRGLLQSNASSNRE
jgi:acetoin utilization deacetylase AcuC-like enzyme